MLAMRQKVTIFFYNLSPDVKAANIEVGTDYLPFLCLYHDFSSWRFGTVSKFSLVRHLIGAVDSLCNVFAHGRGLSVTTHEFFS